MHTHKTMHRQALEGQFTEKSGHNHKQPSFGVIMPNQLIYREIFSDLSQFCANSGYNSSMKISPVELELCGVSSTIQNPTVWINPNFPLCRAFGLGLVFFENPLIEHPKSAYVVDSSQLLTWTRRVGFSSWDLRQQRLRLLQLPAG